MITVQLTGERELITRLNALPDQLRVSLGRTVTRLAIELERNVKLKLSGAVLNVRSGVLRASIHHQIQQTTTGVTATVGTSVKYGKFHEEGVPHSWVIKPKSARALAFEVGGKTVFAQEVIHPPLPVRSFLLSTLREMTPYIKEQINVAVKEVVAAR